MRQTLVKISSEPATIKVVSLVDKKRFAGNNYLEKPKFIFNITDLLGLKEIKEIVEIIKK